MTVLQRAENLPDRQAAEAVRTRIDWQYLLGLPFDDPGFDPTVLVEFRARVADAGLEQVVLDALLERLVSAGLVKAGGKQRTDSTHVIAAVAALNRLELVGESVRAALEALAAAHPVWLEQRVCVSDFARRYGAPMTSWHPPASQAKRDELAIAYARDGYALLEAVYDSSAPAWLRELPAIDVLRRVLVQNYTRAITGDGREVVKRREKEPEGGGLPPGHLRIASPYDLDARWGVKREEFWLGYKLHVTETCDDPPPCSCRPDRPASQPAGGDEPGGSRAGGREHDKGCAQVAFPNLITNVASTDATVTDNQMTGVIDDDLAAKKGVEGTMHQAASHGARRARYRGLPKTRLDHVYMATALNLLPAGGILGRQRRWTGGEPATWHASNSASPHDSELTSRISKGRRRSCRTRPRPERGVSAPWDRIGSPAPSY